MTKSTKPSGTGRGNESTWIENLSRETLLKLIEIGDGHSIVRPELYQEAGLPDKIIEFFTEVHRSRRVPTEELQVLVADTVEKVFDELSTDGYEYDEYCAEELSFEIAANIADHGFKDIYDMIRYSPKETIFTNGVIVDELKGVYSLDLLESVARGLNLPLKCLSGRGFRFADARNAIKIYLDIEKSTK